MFESAIQIANSQFGTSCLSEVYSFPSVREVPYKVWVNIMKIFVGNLSFNTTENDLNNLFAQVGTVEAVSIITDRDTGRSKGFGFVTMNDDEASKAIAQLSGTQLDGRTLTINEARPMVKREFGERSRSGGGGNRGRGGYDR
jgi:cold-inducible RNA-binding protein